MSEISETQSKLDELMNEYEAAVIGENRGRNRSGYSEKADKYYQKRRELKEFVAELEAESERFTVHSRIKRQDDKWIPVSERLPEKQKLTIGFTDNSAYVFFEIVNDDEMGLVMYPYQNRKGTVTHWMPLPSTPEVQE